MSTNEFLQIFFYFSGIISIMIGSFSLYMDHKAALNRTFFALCFSLSIWAIGFSMAINATDIEACLFWRRFSAVGWGSMFGILLHFCIIYSGKAGLIKKWWVYLLIYVPAAIILYIFAISNATALLQYNFVWTSFGWTNIAFNNVWDWFFDLYYAGYVIYGLSIVWLYGRSSHSSKVRKQVKLIVYSFFVAFLLGSATDILCNAILTINMPQIAPIIILLPIMATYYSIIQYGFMNPKQIIDAEVILTKSTQQKVYTNLSIALVTGSFISYFVQYLYYENLFQPLFSSSIILILGAVIYIFKSVNVGDNVKDNFLIIIIFIAIPSITLNFIDFGGVTIWAVSFMFILISMVFNKPIVLFSVSVSILSTQVLLWIIKPEANIVIDKVDYIGRIGILCITIWIAYYVNKIYINRLKANADQMNLQRFISEVSSDFLNVNQSNIDEKMNWVIRILGKLFSLDRINILLVDTVQYTVDYSNIWNVDKSSADDNLTYKFDKDDISWMLNQLISNESIFIDVENLPETVAGIRNRLKIGRIHSFIAIPIAENAKSIKVLQFTSVNPANKWKDEDLRVLKIIANIFNDALLKVEAENEISYMAYHDHLTGLPNRILFKDRLNQAIALAKRTEKMVGIIFIDLDSFKTINDTIGHEGGDSLLKIISQKLFDAVRQSDTVSRFGGDEFLILINNISQGGDIIGIAEKIMSILKQPLLLNGQEFNLTTSVGIALYPFDGTDIDILIKNADIAMYKAKENGKNQYVICSSELKNEVINKIRITNSLYHALERDEFSLYYQPQVNLYSGDIIGLEALIRWNHPEFGFIPPAVFIPIAEQIGVINNIGEWVFKKACKQNKTWQDCGYISICIAVNVSANQLRNINFIDQINQTLNETGLDPGFLEIEITESAAMSETGDVIALMNKIRSLGIMIAIDDFGTVYSSLSRLNELPIDKIKIDKQFIDGIEAGEKNKAIVRTIINLAKNLELKVIAEGVENIEQIEFLKQELCEQVQGYYYYKPLQAQDIESILRKNNSCI